MFALVYARCLGLKKVARARARARAILRMGCQRVLWYVMRSQIC